MTMTPNQLTATGEWDRSGEWPHYQGEGPRYQHRSLDIRLQGYATHRNTRRRGSRGITKVRRWQLYVNGEPMLSDSRFGLMAERAAVIAINSATQPVDATVTTARLRQGEPIAERGTRT